MKVLMVEPGKVPYAAEIGEGLEPLQAAVGGDIQAVYPYDDPVALICNEEGKYMGLPLNRALHDDEGNIYDIVAGNFFLCGLGEEDFTDLPADLMEKYRQQFEHPEQFVRIAGKSWQSSSRSLPLKNRRHSGRRWPHRRHSGKKCGWTSPRTWPLTWMCSCGSTVTLMRICTPVFHEEKERMADELLSGQTGKIRMRMATVIQEEHLNGEAGRCWIALPPMKKNTGSAPTPFTSLTYRTAPMTCALCPLIGWKRKGSR